MDNNIFIHPNLPNSLLSFPLLANNGKKYESASVFISLRHDVLATSVQPFHIVKITKDVKQNDSFM